MKNEALVLAIGLLLMPVVANGQSREGEIAGPKPTQDAAQCSRWRDCYINSRGRKILEPDWQMFRAENGTVFAVNMKSIANISLNSSVVRLVAYLVDGDDFDSNNLITFAFDCKEQFAESVTKASPERVRQVGEQAKKLACH
jgi:hypothetical protein